MSSTSNPIEHVVVLMLENRSYDNVLGWLYGNGSPLTQPAGQAKLDGLYESDGSAKSLSNDDADGNSYPIANAASASVWGTSYPGTTIPAVDPGEQFGDMAQQILSTASEPQTMPYTNYPPSAPPLMGGFVLNYASFAQAGHGNLQDIMNYLTPNQLPVSGWLANNFAVCDQWFASVPTHTFTNRIFSFCAAPAIVSSDSDYSLCDDKDYKIHLLTTYTPESSMLTIPTVCDRLHAKLGGTSWKVYFHDYSIAVMTMPSIAAQAQTPGTPNVATFDFSDWGDPSGSSFTTPKQLVAPDPTKNQSWATTFVQDVTNNALPPFAFIEPRYSSNFAPGGLPPNSNHPGSSNYLPGMGVGWGTPPTDATGGELLIMEIYNLLQTNGYLANTLLIITYDEHGGVYDHVAPPPAVSPGTLNATTPPTTIPTANTFFTLGLPDDPAITGFDYTVYGGRVPAIIVSQNIAAGTAIEPTTSTPFDHSSIVATLFDVFDLGTTAIPSLTARDAAAPSLANAIDAGANNAPGPFAGTIVGNPSAMFLYGTTDDKQTSAMVLASAGPGVTLSASLGTGIAGAIVTQTSGDSGTTIQIFTVTVSNSGGLPEGNFTASLTISGTATGLTVTPLVVPVTMNIIRPLL